MIKILKNTDINILIEEFNGIKEEKEFLQIIYNSVENVYFLIYKQKVN